MTVSPNQIIIIIIIIIINPESEWVIFKYVWRDLIWGKHQTLESDVFKINGRDDYLLGAWKNFCH